MPLVTNQPRIGKQGTERAVSPVIGVILLVAIAALLSGVVVIFVLEIGAQQKKAPITSFAVEERMVTLKSGREKNRGETSTINEVDTPQIIIRHSGGDTLHISQTEIKVDGHRDAWGVVPHATALEMSEGELDDTVEVGPEPDFRRTLGENDQVTVGSGESWNVVAFNVVRGVPLFSANNLQKSLYEPGTRDLETPPANASHDFLIGDEQDDSAHGCNCSPLYILADSSYPKSGPFGGVNGLAEQLKRGEELRVVWSSKSGGKTQTIQKYIVQ